MRLRDKLLRKFGNSEYRRAYVESFLDSFIATQIKVLREQRQLSQTALAERAGMKQSQISKLEDVNNASWQIRTLKRIANALDLALVVRFESFGNVLPAIENMERAALERASFDDDPVFRGGHVGVNIGSCADFGPQPEDTRFAKSGIVKLENGEAIHVRANVEANVINAAHRFSVGSEASAA